ncbi:MAG TPA: hypothetical protein VNZ57_12230 [Longimicrobiales bacterium]|nr:hypothetical protein [Longimicrobiales bacterium]
MATAVHGFAEAVLPAQPFTVGFSVSVRNTAPLDRDTLDRHALPAFGPHAQPSTVDAWPDEVIRVPVRAGSISFHATSIPPPSIL